MRPADDPHRAPVLPFDPRPVTNGEFVPLPPTRRDRWIAQETLARVAEVADRLRLDRRSLLHHASGMAAMLGVVNLAACGGDDRGASPTTGGATPTSAPGGTFDVPDPTDVEACAHALAGDEFVFDVHTHHVMPDGPWRQNAPRIAQMVRNLVPDGCLEDDPYRCLDRASYLHDMFLASDTTVALLSDVPNSGPDDAPMPWEDARGTQDFAAALAGAGAPRVLLHNVLAPNFGPLPARLDDMAAAVATGDVAAFKVYTAWGPGRTGFALDDPAIGIPVVEQARSLGVRIMCAHKGLPLYEFDQRFNGPDDMARLAAQYPDVQFVVYHSAFERETYEGPYDPSDARRGVNSLVKAMDDAGLPPSSNLWAELGTAWRETMTDPTQAAHLLGKLLRRVGEDRVMWGTDAIWLGSPQPQIMAFRAFQISGELQERFGYPALTDALKRKVLGLNGAALFGLDADALRCGLDADALASARAEQREMVAAGALPPPWQPRGPVTRREFLAWVGDPATRWSPV